MEYGKSIKLWGRFKWEFWMIFEFKLKRTFSLYITHNQNHFDLTNPPQSLTNVSLYPFIPCSYYMTHIIWSLVRNILFFSYLLDCLHWTPHCSTHIGDENCLQIETVVLYYFQHLWFNGASLLSIVYTDCLCIYSNFNENCVVRHLLL